MPRRHRDLGPLPTSDANAELEDESIRALDALLPASKFVFRQEPRPDAGVDGTLELRINSQYTNLRSHVQLKATAREGNRDGSFSISVAVSNINYLLNGSSPIYLLYIAKLRQFRFAWVRDECRRLSSQYPSGFDHKANVSIRFTDVLTQENLDCIHERIRKEGLASRNILKSLSLETFAEPVQIAIDPETLAISSSTDAQTWIMSSGLTMIACGYAAKVIDAATLLPTQVSRDSRISLVLAYAHHTLGHHRTAQGHIAQARLDTKTLSASDLRFLEHLSDACAYMMGAIDITIWRRRQEERAANELGSASFGYRLDSLREQYLLESDTRARSALYDEIKMLVRQLLGMDDQSEGAKLQAQLALLHVEGAELTSRILMELSAMQMQALMNRPIIANSLTDIVGTELANWEIKMEALIGLSRQSPYPLLLADALVTRASERTTYLAVMKCRSFKSHAEIPETMLLQSLQDADDTRKIYLQAENLEGELNSITIMADLFELKGSVEAAVRLCEGVLPRAEAFEYRNIIEHARQHINRDTLLTRDAERREKSQNTDVDFQAIAHSSRDYVEVARATARALQLPDDRLPNLILDLQSQYDISKARVEYCMHIEILQDLTHSRSPETYYATNPNRVCVCMLHGYRSNSGTPDWQAQISEFKSSYCNACGSRRPKTSDT